MAIEELDAEPFAAGSGAAISGEFVFAVKVKVESFAEKLRILVEPRRFRVETADGKRFYPRQNTYKEPLLPRGYIQGGQSVGGWLTFSVPAEAKGLVLKSDLRKPDWQSSLSMLRQ